MIHYDTLGNSSNLYYFLQRSHLYLVSGIICEWWEVCQPPRTPGQDLKRWSYYNTLQLHRSRTKWALKASNLRIPANHRNNSAYLLLQLDPISFKKNTRGIPQRATRQSEHAHQHQPGEQSKPSETTLFVITPFPFWPRVAINLKNNVYSAMLWQQRMAHGIWLDQLH